MRNIPILFSAPMIRALLDGSKTQTRRHLYVVRKFGPACAFDRRYLPPLLDMEHPQHGPGECFTLSRAYEPGDRLWVKETIQQIGPLRSCYAADDTLTKATAWPWKRKQLNSIHCPRGLSRITLEVTDVRVERLQDISEADALAEGITHSTLNDPRVEYRWLWESINGAGSWGQNPWVWCISFKRL